MQEVSSTARENPGEINNAPYKLSWNDINWIEEKSDFLKVMVKIFSYYMISS